MKSAIRAVKEKIIILFLENTLEDPSNKIDDLSERINPYP